MAKRKKKVEEPKLPDRVYIPLMTTRDKLGYEIVTSRLGTPRRGLNSFEGNISPVGEYVLVRTGTTRTLLGDLEEEK